MPTLHPRRDASLLKLQEIRDRLAANPTDDYGQHKSRDLAFKLAEAVLPDIAEMADLGVQPGHVAAIVGAAFGTFLANVSIEVDRSDPGGVMTDLALRAQLGAASCFARGLEISEAAPPDVDAPTTTAAQ